MVDVFFSLKPAFNARKEYQQNVVEASSKLSSMFWRSLRTAPFVFDNPPAELRLF